MSKQENKWVLPLDINEQTLPIIEQITDGMPGGFFIYHADGNEELIYANTATINIFGCDSLDDFRSYISNSFQGMIHPEDLEQVEVSIHSQISKSSKGLDYVEYRVIRKDGMIRWIRDYGRFIHTSLYGDVFYVFIEDATERHLKELSDARAVQMARERLEVLRQLEYETTTLRMMNEIFSYSMWSMEFNGLGEITSVNWSDAFRSMLGYQDETDFPNVLESWTDLLHEEDKERVLTDFYNTISNCTEKRSFSAEYRLLTRNRGWRWFQSAGKLSRREDGTPITYLGIFVDITHQKLTDEALESQRKLLTDALQQAHQSRQARNIFLNNMSYDFHTPMNAITGFTTLAKLSIDDKKAVSDYLDQIMSASNDLQTLISNLLTLSQIESKDISLNEAPCILPNILCALESNVQAEVDARQLKLSIKNEKLIHQNIICDQQQLYQALMNIVDNALKFTPAGGQISIRLSELQGAPPGYGFYKFEIQDTGVGMSQDTLNHMFEPFDHERTSKAQNTGMGMGTAIAKNILEKMGGSIKVESEEGKGSKFSVSIQFRLAEENKKA